MVINLRGTSGSGKSTIVRTLMQRYMVRTPNFREGRKQPVSYTCTHPDHKPLFVVGHYETACGGGDTINGLDVIYEMVNNAAERGEDVIYEGLILQSDVLRCIDTAKRFPTIVIGLNTSLDECIAGIQSRRDARGDTRPLSPKNTIAKMKTMPHQQRRLKDAGVNFKLLNRADAMVVVLEALQWS